MLPNLFRRLLAEGQLNAALVPTLQGPVDLLLPEDLPTAATPAGEAGWRRLLLPMPWRQRWSSPSRGSGV